MSGPRRTSLITDGDVVRLENYLERFERTSRATLPRDEKARLHASWEGFALVHGLRWARGSDSAKTVRRMTPGSCFLNACYLAMERGLVYVEGFAMYNGAGVHHAWCADREGRVVDPTWPPLTVQRTPYIGVPMVLDAVVAWARKTHRHGVFFAWSKGLLDGTLRASDFVAGTHEGHMRAWYLETKALKPKDTV